MLVHVIGRAIVREAGSPRRQSTGDDLILAATRQRDIEAASVATDDMVCFGNIVSSRNFCGFMILNVSLRHQIILYLLKR